MKFDTDEIEAIRAMAIRAAGEARGEYADMLRLASAYDRPWQHDRQEAAALRMRQAEAIIAKIDKHQKR